MHETGSGAQIEKYQDWSTVAFEVGTLVLIGLRAENGWTKGVVKQTSPLRVLPFRWDANKYPLGVRFEHLEADRQRYEDDLRRGRIWLDNCITSHLPTIYNDGELTQYFPRFGNLGEDGIALAGCGGPIVGIIKFKTPEVAKQVVQSSHELSGNSICVRMASQWEEQEYTKYDLTNPNLFALSISFREAYKKSLEPKKETPKRICCFPCLRKRAIICKEPTGGEKPTEHAEPETAEERESPVQRHCTIIVTDLPIPYIDGTLMGYFSRFGEIHAIVKSECGKLVGYIDFTSLSGVTMVDAWAQSHKIGSMDIWVSKWCPPRGRIEETKVML